MPEQNHPPMQSETAPLSNTSASFGKVPNDAESFRTVPNGSEDFRTFPKGSERKENHTLTVRETARLFEAAGVARTERSITNWCQPNKAGIARLDAYFDPNERKYFITPQSVELAVAEEKAKAEKGGVTSETTEGVPNDSETRQPPPTADTEGGSVRVKALEQEIMDLKITNRGKDYFIEQLQKERDGFAQERQEYVEKLVNASRKVGELETRLLQLEAPHDNSAN